MTTPGTPGPPDKYAKIRVDGKNSATLLAELNAAAQQGFTGPVVVIDCTDGRYAFVGGYQ